MEENSINKNSRVVVKADAKYTGSSLHGPRRAKTTKIMLFVRDLKDIPHVLVAVSAKKLNDLTRFFFLFATNLLT